MPFADVARESEGSVELFYQDFGSGRPVVLIHGWPLSGRSWEAQVPALVDAGYRVIAYDRRGFGQSSQPWDGYDYDTFAADLDALLTQLDVRDAVLVGFSMGGGEVARYLGRYGTDRVSGAVFAAAVPPYLYKSDDNPDGGLDDATIEQFEGGVRGDRPAFLTGFLANFFAAGDRSDLVSPEQHEFAKYLAFAASPKGTLDCIAAFGRTDFRNDLAAITVPTLIIHGDSDGIVPFEVSGKRTHEAIAGSTLVLIEGGPHGINASHVEQFNSALIDFLNASAGDGTAAAAAPSAAAASAGTAGVAAAGGRHEASEPEPAAADTEVPEPTQINAVPASDAPDGSDEAPAEPAAASAAETDEAPAAPTATRDEPTRDEPTSDQPAASDAPAAAPSHPSDDPIEAAIESGFVWTTNEDDGVVPDDHPIDAKTRREGMVPDPNLGDIPVDEQPHRGH